MSEWHIVTCEYPPAIGGVSDYTFAMAAELAKAGDSVHVWCGAVPEETPQSSGVTVHRDLGCFSPGDLRRASRLLDKYPEPRRVFVQWVPHGYGYHSMNVFFVLWLWWRAKIRTKQKRDQLDIMFHEVWLSFGISWKANFASVVHRIMVAFLKHAASKIWISCEAWRTFVMGAKAPVRCLPVPSCIPGDAAPERISTIRQQCHEQEIRSIVGHLGIGDALVKGQLRQFVPMLLREKKDAGFLLIGKSSKEFAQELQTEYPDLAERILGTGALAAEEIPAYINACDLMVQPYVDGISTRRTAAMASLANGRALLTTYSPSTEIFWLGCDGLAIVSACDTKALIVKALQLLKDDRGREQMGFSGKQFYHVMFDISVSAQALRGDREPSSAQQFARPATESVAV